MVVTGFADAARRRFLAACLAARPVDEDWLLLGPTGIGDEAPAGPRTAGLTGSAIHALVQPRDEIARADPDSGPGSDGPHPGPSSSLFRPSGCVERIDLSGACACCAAGPVLRARLPLWLRRRAWHRLIIELPAEGRPADLVDILRREPLAHAVGPVTVLVVVAGEPGAARAFETLTDPAAPALLQALAQEQLEAAAGVWIDDPVTDLADRLAAWPPFGRAVTTHLELASRWVLAAPPLPPALRTAACPTAQLPGSRGAPAGAPGLEAAASDRLDPQRPRLWWWPAEQRRSRRAFLDMLRTLGPPPAADAATGRSVRLWGAFATERESYRFIWEPADTDGASNWPPSLMPTGYRGPGALMAVGPFAPVWLAHLDAALAAWLEPLGGLTGRVQPAVDPEQ